MTTTAGPQALVDLGETKAMKDKRKPSSVAEWCATQWKPILAELVSTAMLIFFGCMTCIPIEGLPEQSPLYGSLGFGLTVMFNIQIFGHISGAHMNPAVTLASILWGSISIVLGIAYFIAQVLGAMIGYGLLMGLAPTDVAAEGACVNVAHRRLNVFQALGIEILLTATLCFICCSLWDPVNKHKQDSVPIKFGLAITGLSLAGGPYTGASMNPVRSFGPALWSGIWHMHWVFWVGPFVGSILATLFYKLIFLKNAKPLS